jgi:UDP-sulfoquinovose synthase
VARVAHEHGLPCEIAHLANPRVEREDHYYNCINTNLRSLGLEPTPLSDATIAGLIDVALEHLDRVDARLIPPRVTWRAEEAPPDASAVA